MRKFLFHARNDQQGQHSRVQPLRNFIWQCNFVAVVYCCLAAIHILYRYMYMQQVLNFSFLKKLFIAKKCFKKQNLLFKMQICNKVVTYINLYIYRSTHLTTICVNVRDRVCLSVVCPLSPPGLLEVWKHEWYHVVTNCQGHVLSPSGLPKVTKNCQKKPKPPQRHVIQPKGHYVVG